MLTQYCHLVLYFYIRCSCLFLSSIGYCAIIINLYNINSNTFNIESNFILPQFSLLTSQRSFPISYFKHKTLISVRGWCPHQTTPMVHMFRENTNHRQCLLFGERWPDKNAVQHWHVRGSSFLSSFFAYFFSNGKSMKKKGE